MLKGVCGTGLHVLNRKRGQNSHIKAHTSSYPQENEEENHTNTLSWRWYKVQDTKEIQSKISSVTATLSSGSWPETVPCSHTEGPVMKGIIIFSDLLSRPRVCSTSRAFALWCPGQFWAGVCPACVEERLSPCVSLWGGWCLWSAVGLPSFRKGVLTGNPCRVRRLFRPCESSWICCGWGTVEGIVGCERPGNHSKELQVCVGLMQTWRRYSEEQRRTAIPPRRLKKLPRGQTELGRVCCHSESHWVNQH